MLRCCRGGAPVPARHRGMPLSRDPECRGDPLWSPAKNDMAFQGVTVYHTLRCDIATIDKEYDNGSRSRCLFV